MNILGIGGPELILILLVMLIIAGPKRMIQWSYVLGKWVAKFRVMWSQTVDMVQKEFDASGVDIKLPKTPPTRKNLAKMVEDAVAPVNDPLRKTLDDVKADMQQIDDDLGAATKSKSTSFTSKPVANLASKKASAAKPTTPAEDASAAAMGAWSGTPAQNGAGAAHTSGTHNGSSVTPAATASPPAEAKFGSWSGPTSKPDDASPVDDGESEADAS